MQRMARFTMLMTFVFFSGCASQGSLDNVRNDVDAVKTRLFSIEREMGGIRDESKTGQTKVKDDVASVRKLSADIQATIDSAKSDMQTLNGRIDDMTISAKKQTEEMARYREDSDKRILALEERIVKLQTTLEELSKRSGDGTAINLSAPSPEALYKKGLEKFKAGDMAAARDNLNKFIEQNPKHELIPNAHYWVGETLYGEKQYEQAILAFQEVIKKYPQQPKVPAAMLKQALAFRAIKDTKSARYVLRKLVESYPKSEEGKKAKTLLKQIK